MKNRLGATRNLSNGHGIETGVEYGPVLNEAVRERAKRDTDDAVARGGRLLAGGRPPKDGVLSGGTFSLPTVVDRVPIEARVMNEETYGPVAAIHHASGDKGYQLAPLRPGGLRVL